MPPVLQIVLLWLLFAGSHMWLSSRSLRPKLVARLGDRAFLGLYSLVSFLIFIPLVAIYMEHRHAGPVLWMVAMTPLVTWFVYALVTLGLLIFVAGLVSPSPTSMTSGGATPEIRGVHRITRHPVLMGFGLIGLAHLIPNTGAADVAFFSGLPLFAVIGCRHQENRQRASRGPAFEAYLAATPFLPFSSLGAFRGLIEIPLPVWAGALALSAGLRWLH